MRSLGWFDEGYNPLLNYARAEDFCIFKINTRGFSQIIKFHHRRVQMSADRLPKRLNMNSTRKNRRTQ